MFSGEHEAPVEMIIKLGCSSLGIKTWSLTRAANSYAVMTQAKVFLRIQFLGTFLGLETLVG